MVKAPVDHNLNDAKVEFMSTHAFCDDYLRLYSAHSNVRGIPFIGDGFKEAQRKAIWGVLDRGENADEVTVERLGSLCAASTDYHHGTGSMMGTIIGLAQAFAGSNNVNFLHPEGQFGSRLSHGASAPRYIFTRLHENFRQIFRKEDDVILDQIKVGNLKIEPKYFIPLLPIVLLNGSEGMGTGHATHVFSYSPTDLKNAILKVLDGKSIPKFGLVPFWKGFSGGVRRDKANGQVIVTGKIENVNSTTLKISELPIGFQSDAYERHLFALKDRTKKRNGRVEPDPAIKRFENESCYDEETDSTDFDFTITVPRTTSYLTNDELIKLFKLEMRDTENFTVWGPDGLIKKYDSAEDLLYAFVTWRLERYEDRRQKQMQICRDLVTWLTEVMRFIEYYLQNTELFKVTEDEALFKLLADQKFTQVDRLLSMAIRSLTKDKIDDLRKKLEAEQDRLKKLEVDVPIEMYRRELKELKFTF